MEMQIESALSVHGPRPMELSTFGNAGPEVNGKLRKSSLESPIMLLTGHQSAVYTMKFNPSGTIIASGSHDKEIFLWNVHGDCKNFAVLKGHKNAVLDVQWSTDGSTIISASPDKTVRAWDVETGKQIKKMVEHSSFVNSCCPARRGPPLIVSGSDDGTAKLWDMRQRGAIQTFPDKYQITAVAFSDASDKIYTGGIDNDVKVWDLRRNEVTMTLQGHQDMITGMQLSPDGSYLLTNGMDCTLRIWDMRPYAPQNRCVKLLEGHQHNFEKNLLKCGWLPDGSKVTAGSSDTMVYTWDTTSRRILYKLPGHNGCVNETAFHPSGYVPEEIIEDILVKLPVKSIIRFKSVSKSWFNLIKSTNFIYKHSQEDMSCFLHAMCLVVSDRLSSRSIPAVCIYHKETSSSSASRSGIFNTSQSPQASDYKWRTVPLMPCPGLGLVLVGNCNGILCFNRFGNIMLVNPLLSEVKKLPHSTIIGFDLVGFGFDNTTMDFKVVRIVRKPTQKKTIVRKQAHQVVEVCNLRSNAWRELDETGIPLVDYSLDNICSTFLDGKVYWCVDQCNGGQQILTFNLATELFQLMEFPQDYPLYPRVSNPRLIVIDQESLAFVSYPQGSYSMDLDLVHLWTMNNKHNENEQVTTWTKLCSFQPPPHLLTPISFSKKHNKFLYQTTRDLEYRLIIYDLINQSSSSVFQHSKYHQRRNIRNLTRLQVGVWRPSLISLN